MCCCMRTTSCVIGHVGLKPGRSVIELSSALQAALAGVKAVVRALPEASLAASAGAGGALLPPLLATFAHPAADVRKATVMALVELCLVRL